jgi:ribosomal protein S27E
MVMANLIKAALIVSIIGLIIFVAADMAMLLMEDSKLLIFGIGALGSIFVLVGIILIFMALDIKLKIPSKKAEPAVEKEPQPAPAPQPTPPQPPVQQVSTQQAPPQPAPQPQVSQQKPPQVEVGVTQKQQEVKKVRCPACSTVFSYTKNPKGPTWVKCPSCGKEGVVY